MSSKSTMQGTRRVVALVALVLAVGAVAGPGAARAHGPTIEITHEAMKPSLLNLFVGSTVHFTNTVDMPGGHVIVDATGTIESPPLEKPGDDWHYTFEEVGTYELHIRQHPQAKARIVIVPKRTAPGAP
jgi:plastocyanin